MAATAKLSGRKHGMQHKGKPVGHIVRRLEEIFDRAERTRIAIEPDMCDAR